MSRLAAAALVILSAAALLACAPAPVARADDAAAPVVPSVETNEAPAAGVLASSRRVTPELEPELEPEPELELTPELDLELDPGPERDPAPQPLRAAGDWDPKRVTIMSFNVLWGLPKQQGENGWPTRRRIVFEVLRRRAPDVIGLQEPRPFQVDEIKSRLPQYGEVGYGRRPDNRRGHRCAILYRLDRFRVSEEGVFWLSDTPEKPNSATWGNETARVCNWARLVDKRGRGAFYVFNLHLEPGRQRHIGRSVELLARRIRDRRYPRDPVVVTGDFNSGEVSPALRFLKGEVPRAIKEGPAPPTVRFVDSYRVLHPDAKEVSTYHAFRGGRRGMKIDYVLVPPEMTVLDAKIIRDHASGKFPSDHYPVSATIAWPP